MHHQQTQNGPHYGPADQHDQNHRRRAQKATNEDQSREICEAIGDDNNLSKENTGFGPKIGKGGAVMPSDLIIMCNPSFCNRA